MAEYFHTDETTIKDFSPDFIGEMYEKGYVFTRIGRGVMHKTRSVRINLSEFNPSSENRRILKKTEGLNLAKIDLPYKEYSWQIGKLAKDFYGEKFGDGIMSAQKVKEMLTDNAQSNFNSLLVYTIDGPGEKNEQNEKKEQIGYTIAYTNNNIMHYSYPFYDTKIAPKDAGLGMMIRAIMWAKENGLKYAYLGSLQRPGDVYKLQFDGLEWFDGTQWSNDTDAVKSILKS